MRVLRWRWWDFFPHICVAFETKQRSLWIYDHVCNINLGVSVEISHCAPAPLPTSPRVTRLCIWRYRTHTRLYFQQHKLTKLVHNLVCFFFVRLQTPSTQLMILYASARRHKASLLASTLWMLQCCSCCSSLNPFLRSFFEMPSSCDHSCHTKEEKKLQLFFAYPLSPLSDIHKKHKPKFLTTDEALKTCMEAKERERKKET